MCPLEIGRRVHYPDLVSGKTLPWRDGKAALTLAGEDVAVLQLE